MQSTAFQWQSEYHTDSAYKYIYIYIYIIYFITMCSKILLCINSVKINNSFQDYFILEHSSIIIDVRMREETHLFYDKKKTIAAFPT